MQKENNIYRYNYYEELEAKNPLHATVITMNPAFADSEESDDTIKNIKKYLGNEDNKFGSFGIINLYPIRMPKSETEKYHEFVKSYLKENCKDHVIIAAWGTKVRKKDKNIILSSILNKITDLKIYAYAWNKNSNCPYHPATRVDNKKNGFPLTKFLTGKTNLLELAVIKQNDKFNLALKNI